MVHLQDKRYGTLTGDDGKEVGRMACARDPYQRLPIVSVRATKRGVTCKRCLRLK